MGEEGYKKTHETFLDECKYLEECKYYHQKGMNLPNTIHGKKLFDYLFLNSIGIYYNNLV